MNSVSKQSFLAILFCVFTIFSSNHDHDIKESDTAGSEVPVVVVAPIKKHLCEKCRKAFSAVQDQFQPAIECVEQYKHLHDSLVFARCLPSWSMIVAHKEAKTCDKSDCLTADLKAAKKEALSRGERRSSVVVWGIFKIMEELGHDSNDGSELS